MIKIDTNKNENHNKSEVCIWTISCIDYDKKLYWWNFKNVFMNW